MIDVDHNLDLQHHPHHHHVTTTRICNPYSHLTYLTLIFPQQPGIKGKLHQLEVVPRNGLVVMTIIIIRIQSHYHCWILWLS